jgi:hypothetical protein
MKFSLALLLCFFASVSFAAADKSLVLARETLLSASNSPQAALLKYAAAAKKTVSGPVAAEYSYALAYAGLPEAALYNIDRALITEPLHAEVRFYLSELLNAFGLADASDEIQAPVPAWLKTPLRLPALHLPAPAGDFETASAAVNLLLAQKRYAQGAMLLDRLCKAMPENARCAAGYALALEKLGCFKTAAAQARRNRDLAASPERKAAAAAYAADLEKRPPLKYSAPAGKLLKGRYLAFLGGSLDRADGETTYAFSSRAGRFVSERLDISFNAALNGGNPISDYNGLTLGAGLRGNAPLGFAPLNGTLAAKVERVPAPEDNLALILSPGFSYFMADSSIDLFWDLALAGQYGGSVTMSVGYTVYFGVGK